MMSFIHGSVTTFQGKPPSFNMIYLDPVTMLPVDHEIYAFDLEGANTGKEPQWNKFMSYREDYNLTDLSPQSFYEHSKQIRTNETAAKQYRNNRFIGGPGDNYTEPCDSKCRMGLWCQTTASDYEDWAACTSEDLLHNKHLQGPITGELGDIVSQGFSVIAFENILNHDWYKPKNETSSN